MTPVVYTLLGQRSFQESVCCLTSFYRCCKPTPTIVALEDGTLDAAQIGELESKIPGLRVSRRTERDVVIERALAPYPHLSQFRRSNVLGQKLIDPSIFCESRYLYFVDSDLFFKEQFLGFLIDDAVESAPTFLCDVQSAYALSPRRTIVSNWPALPRRLNTGMYRIGREHFSLAVLEEFLRTYGSDLNQPSRACWAEQTLFALQAGGAPALFWSNGQIRIASATMDTWQAEGIVGIHFVSSERHRLWSYASRNVLVRERVITLQEQPFLPLTRWEFVRERMSHRLSCLRPVLAGDL